MYLDVLYQICNERHNKFFIDDFYKYENIYYIITLFDSPSLTVHTASIRPKTQTTKIILVDTKNMITSITLNEK